MLEIGKNALLAPDVYEMTLVGDASAITAPGQFINIRLDGLYLRRPISVCDWGEGWIRVIYKVVGKGTAQMAQMTPGQKLDVLTGLGNGYDLAPARGKRIALVGGGVGIPPLYGLAKRLGGEAFCCVLGFNRASEIFYAEEFARYGKVVHDHGGRQRGRARLCDGRLAPVGLRLLFRLRAGGHAAGRARAGQGRAAFL